MQHTIYHIPKTKDLCNEELASARDLPRDTCPRRLSIHGLTANAGGISMRQPRLNHGLPSSISINTAPPEILIIIWKKGFPNFYGQILIIFTVVKFRQENFVEKKFKFSFGNEIKDLFRIFENLTYFWKS